MKWLLKMTLRNSQLKDYVAILHKTRRIDTLAEVTASSSDIDQILSYGKSQEYKVEQSDRSNRDSKDPNLIHSIDSYISAKD